MTDAPDTPAPNAPPTDSDETDWSRPFVMRQLQLLGDLAEIGLEVARGVERRVKAAAADDDLGPEAMAYSRTSRAVRLTVMLQSKLIKDVKADEQAEDKARAEAEAKARAAREAADPAYQTKARVDMIVARVAQARHAGDQLRLDRLTREAAERLDDEDLYGDLLEHPLSEIVARLCKDLGLDPDWSELAQELWAVREVESGEVGWPLAADQARPLPFAGGEGAMANDLAIVTNAPEWVERAFSFNTG